jgi:O-antigen ligase
VSGSILIFLLRPVLGLVVFITASVWYPYYLTVKLGMLDFSLARILICVIYARIFLIDGTYKSFRLQSPDKLMIVFAALCLVAGLTTTESVQMVEYWGGSVFDTLLPYFAIRLIVKNKDDYYKLIKWVMIVSIPYAITAVYQSVTGNNPFGFMESYNAFSLNHAAYTPQLRTGFYRANLTFGVSIMLGLYYAVIFGWSAGLASYVGKNQPLFYAGMATLILGLAASMSSGPLTALVVLIPVLVLFRYRKYWKVFIAFVIGGIVIIEIASNTRWYEAMSRLTFSEETAYYRIMLIRKALGGGMAGHWLAGFGLFDPGWGPDIFGKAHTDLVNQYLEILVMYGLLGFLPFVAVLFACFKVLRESFLKAGSEADRWLIWSLMSTLVAMMAAFMSVSLFAQTRTVFFMLLAFCANTPGFVSSKADGAFPGICVDNMPIDRFIS